MPALLHPGAGRVGQEWTGSVFLNPPSTWEFEPLSSPRSLGFGGKILVVRTQPSDCDKLPCRRCADLTCGSYMAVKRR